MKLFSGSGRHSAPGKHSAKPHGGKMDPERGLRAWENAGDEGRTEEKRTSPEPAKHAPRTEGASRERTPERRDGAGRQTEKAPDRKKSRLLIAAIVLGTIVLLAMIALAAFEIWADAPDIDKGGLVTKEPTVTDKPGDTLSTPQPAATPKPEATPEPDGESKATPEPAKTGRREGVYTVLVVGQDVAGMNTDTIMVATLDTVNKSLNVVSIPRDTLVNVTWAVKKINSIYGMTGTEEGLVDGISELLGYKVDSYAVVNIYAFEQVIDAIGGVDFDVPMHISWGDPTIGRSYDIPAGMQHLNGHDALGVVRFRKNTDGTGYPTGDIGRVETQQRFALAVAKQMLSLGNIPNLSKIIGIISDNLKTNLTSGNMAYYAQEFLKLDSDQITFSIMPYEPVYIKGGSYVSVNLGAWMEMLNEKLNPYYESITEEHLDILTFSNGSFYSTTGILAGGYDSFYDYMQ